MNADTFALAQGFVSKAYVEQAQFARRTRERLIETLLAQRRMPEHGWDEVTIELFLHELAAMDSNNFVDNIGVGEREARVFSALVARRHYYMGHGIGRSGDLGAIQPKAAGSSLIAQLTRHMTLDAIRLAGIKNASACLVLPLATGMALTMSLLTLRARRPAGARYVLWPRMDQKTCLKAIHTAGCEVVVVPNRLEGDEVRTDLELLEREVARIGANHIVAIVTTSSCFAPRVPDRVVEVARLCKKLDIGHVINNAYGIQCAASCELVAKAGRVGRVDCFVQSLDKNFMVPIGGSVVAAFETAFIDALSKNYPGRASIAPIFDLFVTLLSMGSHTFRDLLQKREELMSYFRTKLAALATSLGERLLETPHNPISMGITLSQFDRAGRGATYLGSMLFSRFCSGVRTVSPGSAQKICGVAFAHYGSHLEQAYPASYLTVACGIGMQAHEVDTFCARLEKAYRQFLKQTQRQLALNSEITTSSGAAPTIDTASASSPAATAAAATLAPAETVCIQPATASGAAMVPPPTTPPVPAAQVAATAAAAAVYAAPAAHTFGGTPLDRSATLKNAQAQRAALETCSARFVIVHAKRVLHTEGAHELVCWTAAQVLALALPGVGAVGDLGDGDSSTCAVLGRRRIGDDAAADAHWVFAVDVTLAFASDDAAVDAMTRALGVSRDSCVLVATRALLPLLDAMSIAIVGRACALLEWHRTARFCGACGAQTVAIECGAKRLCTQAACKTRLYPRTDAVAIALVVDRAADRVLLVRTRAFRGNMYSCVSGFVDGCEAIEEAVRREVREETGVEVGALAFHSSQPWPIGRGGSCELMLGFVAEAITTELHIDAGELVDARWWSRAEVAAAAQWTGGDAGATGNAQLTIPGPYAIAHHLIQHWLAAAPPR